MPSWLKPAAESKPGRFLTQLLRRYFVHDVARQAAALAYYLLFTLFPFLIFLSSLLGLLDLDISSIMSSLGNILPAGVLEVVETYLHYVSQTSSTAMLWFGLVFSIYFPMRAADCLMHAVRRAYHLPQPKNQFLYTVKVLLYTVFLLVTIALTLALATVGRAALRFVGRFIVMPEAFIELWGDLRFVVLGAVMFAAVGLLYAAAQDTRQPVRNIVPGVIIALIGWMIVSAAFSFYVENFANYSVIYGALGTVIILMMWLNLTAVVLILGAEINGTFAAMRGETKLGRISRREQNQPSAPGKGENRMKIIIIGNGKVGFTLARQLSGENHDLVLIDQRAEALQNADSTLDIMCMEGSGASIKVLLEAGVRTADLVVAVTGSDELNIVCCLIAKKLGARHTVARIRSPEYFREANLLKREVGLNMIINPEYAAAQEIGRLLRVPSAFSVETFARGLVELIGFPVLESDGIAGLSLFEYNKKHPNGVLMCAAIRGEEVYVPNGRFVPQVGDKAYVIGAQREISKFFHTLGRDKNRIREISVLGGSKIATYLTWEVEKVGMKVRIVEQDGEKCLTLADKLPDSLIIHGDGTDSAIIESEGLLETDAFIALTNRDEENLLMAMTAQRHGVKKVIAKMSRPNYIDMMRESGVDSIISPKDITANQISAYVRAMARSQGSAVENLYKLLGGAIEAVEFTASPAAQFLDTPLKDLGRRLKPGILVAAIAREGKTIIPDGSASIQAGDRVIVMAKSLFLQDLNDILQEAGKTR